MDRSDDSPLPPFTSPLYTFEAEWANRYRFLNDHGYQLRPRYVPNRAPDWAAKGADAVHCEDAIPAPVLRPHLMDATRKSDGKRVYIKRLSHGENEIRIAQMLSPLSSALDPRNHSVPVLQVIEILPNTPPFPVGSTGPREDRCFSPKRSPLQSNEEDINKGRTAGEDAERPVVGMVPHEAVQGHMEQAVRSNGVHLLDDEAKPGVLRNDADVLPIAQEDAELGNDNEHTAYLVMPFLLPVTEIPFKTIDNMIDFIDQLLEGLVYMHSRGVAHRDCCLKNIMMDADALYPKGFHPVHLGSLPDGFTPGPCLPRSTASVKYYFVDYGISSSFDPNGQEDRTVVGVHGIDQEVPELSLTVPYDPFKVDIFLIGNMLKHEVYMNFKNVGFLKPFINAMTAGNPAARPDAVAAYEHWKATRNRISSMKRSSRLRPRDEGAVVGFFIDLFTAFRLIAQLPSKAVTLARKSSQKMISESHADL